MTVNNLTKKALLISFVCSIVVFIASCNEDNLGEFDKLTLQVTSGNLEQGVNEPFTFKVEANNGKDLTDHVTIKVNDQVINGNTFTSSNMGDYNVVAYYNNLVSNSVNIKIASKAKYSQKVLVEDYTGTWCGNCPRVAYAIELAKEKSDKVVAVAIHCIEKQGDPFTIPEHTQLMKEFKVYSLPKAKINRVNTWSQLEQEHLDEVLNKTGLSAPLGLAIKSEISGNSINMNVKIGFDQDFNNSLNLIVYLIENGIHHEQHNYTEFFKDEEEYEHNDLLQAVYTEVKGDPIPNDQTKKDNIYEVNLNKKIPSKVENQSNLHLVAFVIDKETNEVINVQEAKVGEDLGFN